MKWFGIVSLLVGAILIYTWFNKSGFSLKLANYQKGGSSFTTVKDEQLYREVIENYLTRRKSDAVCVDKFLGQDSKFVYFIVGCADVSDGDVPGIAYIDDGMHLVRAEYDQETKTVLEIKENKNAQDLQEIKSIYSIDAHEKLKYVSADIKKYEAEFFERKKQPSSMQTH